MRLFLKWQHHFSRDITIVRRARECHINHVIKRTQETWKKKKRKEPLRKFVIHEYDYQSLLLLSSWITIIIIAIKTRTFIMKKYLSVRLFYLAFSTIDNSTILFNKIIDYKLAIFERALHVFSLTWENLRLKNTFFSSHLF